MSLPLMVGGTQCSTWPEWWGYVISQARLPPRVAGVQGLLPTLCVSKLSVWILLPTLLRDSCTPSRLHSSVNPLCPWPCLSPEPLLCLSQLSSTLVPRLCVAQVRAGIVNDICPAILTPWLAFCWF